MLRQSTRFSGLITYDLNLKSTKPQFLALIRMGHDFVKYGYDARALCKK